MNNGRLTRLLTNFDKAHKLSQERSQENNDSFESLANDKLGRYYLIYDILFKWDEVLEGKLESSPTKEYKTHVKATLDSFETSVRNEVSRRKLKNTALYRSLNKDEPNRFS